MRACKKNGMKIIASVLAIALCLQNLSMSVSAMEQENTEVSEIQHSEDIQNMEELQNPEDEEERQSDIGSSDEEEKQSETDLANEEEKRSDTDPDEEESESIDTDESVNVEYEKVTDYVDSRKRELLVEKISEARTAFLQLVESGNRMALIYHTDSYQVKNEANTESNTTTTIEIGTTVYVHDVAFTGVETEISETELSGVGSVKAEPTVWYYVSFFQSGEEKFGYIESTYLAYADEEWIAWEQNYIPQIYAEIYAGINPELSTDGIMQNIAGNRALGMSFATADATDVDAFPGAYQSALRTLKNTHPNWTFVPMNTNLDFATVVKNEMGAKSLIQATSSNKENGWVGDACPTESGWNYATESGVSYHIDPRNFLTEDHIFMFEQLTFNASYQSVSAVQNFLNSTFMSGAIPQDEQNRTYAQAFFEIGKNRKLSPTHLASRVYQEQGKGTSPLISGTYPGYEGFYNYFNVNASGSSTEEKIKKGLEWAKSKGWNTRYKSLEGGAATIGNNYILKGQDTIYLEKFNVNSDSPHGLFNHQYMQNIQAPRSEAYSTKKIYAGAGSLNGAFVFKIPVYTGMPGGAGFVLNKKNVNIGKGDSLQLTASMDDTKLAPQDVSWSTADSTVATVKDGLVTAISVGETMLTASYKNNTATCKIVVTNGLQSISLVRDGEPVNADTVITLRRPDTIVQDTAGFTAAEIKRNITTANLQVLYTPEDTSDDKTITWTTSNAKIATVKADAEDSSKAVITAVGSGEVTIKAKASKAGNQEAVCKVKIIAPIYRMAITNPGDEESEADSSTEKTGSISKPYKMYPGQNCGLAADYLPKDTTSDTTVTWTSSNPSVATVNNGKVTALSEGTTVITAAVTGDEKVYTAEYAIGVEGCYVIFMQEDKQTILKKLPAVVGHTVAETDFPVLQDEGDKCFLGWYTKPNGAGSVFNAQTTVSEQETVLYPYYVTMGEGFYVVPVGDQVYTGTAIKPEVIVYDSVIWNEVNHAGLANTADWWNQADFIDNVAGNRKTFRLIQNQDYTVSYKNNIKVSADGRPEATIVIKGKGNYEGMQNIPFRIIPKSLQDKEIQAEDVSLSYTGSIQKKVPDVYCGGKKLVVNRDYTVTYPQTGTGAYRDAGTYPVIIKGKEGYTGTLTVSIVIAKKISLSKVKIAPIPAVLYKNDQVNKETGKGMEPASLTVTYQNKPLVKSTDGGLTGDYTVTYRNNTQVGTATLKITAVPGSEYIGSKSVTYKIAAKAMNRAILSSVEDKTFTGTPEDCEQKMTEVSLVLDGKTLQPSTDGGVTGDYVISYTGTQKAGRATVICQGINEYTGQVKKTYRILPQSFECDLDGKVSVAPDLHFAYYEQGDSAEHAKAVENLSQISAAYVKGGTRPIPIISYKGYTLQEGKDYTVKYTNNKAITVADMDPQKLPQILLVGKGNFSGKIGATFAITDGKMDNSGRKLTMTLKDVIYNERTGGYKTSVTIKDVNGSKLQIGTDYERDLFYTYAQTGEPVQLSDIPAAGTVIRVTAKGCGAYAGDGATISSTYRIVKADLVKAKVIIAPKEYRNGKPVTLSESDITVTINGISEPLTFGRDYVIDADSYEKNLLKGTAYVTIKGADGSDFGGTKRVPFRIKGKSILFR